MAHIHIPDRLEVRYVESSKSANLLFGTMFIVGLASFLIALSQNPDKAWISYVANWLFFSSVSIGAVIFAVATTIVKAKWNWSVRRVSVSFAAFLPIAFVLLLPMLLGLRENYFPWIEAMEYDYIVQKKEAYLNIPFLLSRNIVGVAALFGMALYFAYLAVRPDLGLAKNAERSTSQASWHDRFMKGYGDQKAEEARSWRRMGALGPAIVLVYAVVMSILSYDWAMSLEPHWFSTMFGPWFFMGAFWAGIAATALSVVWIRSTDPDLKGWMGIQQRHDLGKLAFAFTVFWTYLFWAQYLVIWYGKLPWEQAWIIHRSEAPWGALSLFTLVICFIVPFAGLIGRQPKMKPFTLGLFTSVILVGLWMERYLLIAPSLYHDGDPVLPWYQFGISLMFAGLFLFAVRWFWATFPVVQVWQPPAPPEMTEIERAEGVAELV